VETILAAALLALMLLVIALLMLILFAFIKIKRMFNRALTFVFTFSLKPRWKNIK
jgi:hypothetical protein